MCFDNVAYNIAEFVAELVEESEAVTEANEKRKMFYETLTHYELKGKRPSFERHSTIWNIVLMVFIVMERK